MDNFVFCSPTKVLFGECVEKQVGGLIREYGFKKVLLHYGGGSIQKTGLYDSVTQSLQQSGVAYAELGGVSPNPKLSLVREGITFCREEKVDFILAVGGGSVIDSAKAIGMGLRMGGDVWDIYTGKHKAVETVPVGVILTLAAAGSELSMSSVITNEEMKLKRGQNNEVCRPLFAMLNPALTFSVSKFQTACGIVDIIMHTLERYFGTPSQTMLTDSMAEGLMRTVMDAGKRAYANPEDYDARGELIWASSLSHNGITGCGRTGDWATHQLEHEISGMFDHVAHGAGLSVMYPAWARYVCKTDYARFAQLAVNVWGVAPCASEKETAHAGIDAAEAFFKSLDMPTRLPELGVGAECIDGLVSQAYLTRESFGAFKPILKDDAAAIYRLAL